jgi:hypothetical protein
VAGCGFTMEQIRNYKGDEHGENSNSSRWAPSRRTGCTPDECGRTGAQAQGAGQPHYRDSQRAARSRFSSLLREADYPGKWNEIEGETRSPAEAGVYRLNGGICPTYSRVQGF